MRLHRKTIAIAALLGALLLAAPALAGDDHEHELLMRLIEAKEARIALMHEKGYPNSQLMEARREVETVLEKALTDARESRPAQAEVEALRKELQALRQHVRKQNARIDELEKQLAHAGHREAEAAAAATAARKESEAIEALRTLATVQKLYRAKPREGDDDAQGFELEIIREGEKTEGRLGTEGATRHFGVDAVEVIRFKDVEKKSGEKAEKDDEQQDAKGPGSRMIRARRLEPAELIKALTAKPATPELTPPDAANPPEIEADAFLNTDGPITLAGLKGKKPVLVEFWATWCGPCRASIPHMNELHEKYGERLQIVGLTKEPKDKVEAFVEKTPMHYAIGVGSPTSTKYAVHGIPHAYLIDRDGRIQWHGHPMSPDMEKAIEKVVGR